MSDWLRGRRDRIALAFDDEVVRYGELADAVAAAVLPGDGLVACPAGTGAIALVITVLASLEQGRPVLVGGADDAARRIEPELPDGTELALLTSGSSDPAGLPRAVARTNASWLASAEPLAELAGVAARDTVALTGPLHVSMHLYGVLHALRLGATATDRVAEATVVHATPTRLARLAVSPGRRTAIVAGAALSGELRQRAAARGIRVVEYYGAAELSFVAGSDAAEGADAALQPFPGVEIELRPREDGPGTELWARSPYLALGVVGGGMLRRDEHGFATVGDLAERTRSGGIRILGRGDAAITTAGHTVLAEELEAKLSALPGVAAAAVLGEPDMLLGERIVAVVELEARPAGSAGARSAGAPLDAVIATARRALPAAELPRRWHEVEVLPRTPSGKVARGLLRTLLAEGRA